MGITELLPFLVFGGIAFIIWSMLTLISQRNSRAAERLERFSRPAAAKELEPARETNARDAVQGLLEKAVAFSKPLMPTTELEQSKLKTKLANAGFRSEKAASVFLGIKFVFFVIMSLIGVSVFFPQYGLRVVGLVWMAGFAAVGLYLPEILLWWIRRKRQTEIFLTLPDALDLMVVCVESGLGLDAAMRRVCEEMKEHAPVICEELALANLQLQMGRPRRDVLHDLGVRTGVDDVRSLAAILIQADRFGSSVAQALRVQSDSMRTRRKQLAEEKAAKTAVQLIFPLVLFIFPGIFVVLVGPAAIQIARTMFK
jgi:tight adherence protein C